jgi:hypothetical protein
MKVLAAPDFGVTAYGRIILLALWLTSRPA